jgi:hypothetical protein
MHRITSFDAAGIIAYNLRDGGTAVTVFADAQAHRVEKARGFIEALLPDCGERPKIVEPGCSAGDISGYFTSRAEVIGIDVVPRAIELCRERYPDMTPVLSQAEVLAPIDCDILVLCEFLEHIDDPVSFVSSWLPHCRFAVIGHPLEDPGGIEPGHAWSYTLDDYLGWAAMGGHEVMETDLFSGPFPTMVMGTTKRR